MVVETVDIGETPLKPAPDVVRYFDVEMIKYPHVFFKYPHVFFKPTDTIMVAKSPRTGVGPGFDSQGSVPLFHKYCFPNLY